MAPVARAHCTLDTPWLEMNLCPPPLNLSWTVADGRSKVLLPKLSRDSVVPFCIVLPVPLGMLDLAVILRPCCQEARTACGETHAGWE